MSINGSIINFRMYNNATNIYIPDKVYINYTYYAEKYKI